MAGKLKILVLDDEPLVARTVGAVVNSEGAEPVLCGNLAGAVAALKQWDFDGYLLDLRLPDGNGLDLARKIRESDPDAVVILVTGYADEFVMEESRRIGVTEVMGKPFEVDELKKVFRRHIKRRRMEV